MRGDLTSAIAKRMLTKAGSHVLNNYPNTKNSVRMDITRRLYLLDNSGRCSSAWSLEMAQGVPTLTATNAGVAILT
jgi:hypothetical protein